MNKTFFYRIVKRQTTNMRQTTHQQVRFHEHTCDKRDKRDKRPASRHPNRSARNLSARWPANHPSP